jgi:hypothetical protein
MIRFVAKWYISRSIDCDMPLPDWVADRMAKDRQLNHHYQQALHLAKRLRNEPANAETVQVDATGFTPQVVGSKAQQNLLPADKLLRHEWLAGRSRKVMFCAGLAAMILLTFSSWSLFSDAQMSNGTDTPNTELVVKQEPISKDPAKLKSKTQEIAQASRSIMEKLQGKSQQIADSLVQAEEIVALFKSDEGQSGSTYVSTFVDSTSDLGSRYGQVLNSLGEHCQSEKEQLISQGADAVRYFVRDLPLHAIKLAGL